MALNFPDAPVEGTSHSEQGKTWQYTNGVWIVVSGSDAEFLPLAGGTLTGPLIAGTSCDVVGGFVVQATGNATFQSAAQFDLGLTSNADVTLAAPTGDRVVNYGNGTVVGIVSGALSLVVGTVVKLVSTGSGLSAPGDLQVDGNITGPTITDIEARLTALENP